MHFAKMLFHVFAAAEFFRLRHVEAAELSLEALFLDPFFDHGFVLHDSHLRLVSLERHPGEPFGVQFAQLVLIIVIIRRSENHAAQTALRDEGVRSLWRVGRNAPGLVKCVEVPAESVTDGIALGKPDSVVQIAEPKLLRNLTIGLLDRAESDAVTFRTLQNQMRYIKDRIRAAGQLDLPA